MALTWVSDFLGKGEGKKQERITSLPSSPPPPPLPPRFRYSGYIDMGGAKYRSAGKLFYGIWFIIGTEKISRQTLQANGVFNNRLSYYNGKLKSVKSTKAFKQKLHARFS